MTDTEPMKAIEKALEALENAAHGIEYLVREAKHGGPKGVERAVERCEEEIIRARAAAQSLREEIATPSPASLPDEGLVERAAQAFIDAAAQQVGHNPETLAELDDEGRSVLLAGIRAALSSSASREGRLRKALEGLLELVEAIQRANPALFIPSLNFNQRVRVARDELAALKGGAQP